MSGYGEPNVDTFSDGIFLKIVEDILSGYFADSLLARISRNKALWIYSAEFKAINRISLNKQHICHSIPF